MPILGRRNAPGGVLARPVAQRYAHASLGSDANVGDFSRPWASFKKLWGSTPVPWLACLRPGSDYSQNPDGSAPGYAVDTANSSLPGGSGKARRRRIIGIKGQARPKITRRVLLDYNADYWQIEHVEFATADYFGLPSAHADNHCLQAYGDDWRLLRCNLTRVNATDGSCLALGFAQTSPNNRMPQVFEVGHCDFYENGASVTSDNHDHAIYLNAGSNGEIHDCVAWHIYEGFAWHVYSDTSVGVVSGVLIRNCTADDNYQGMMYGQANSASVSDVDVVNCIFSNGLTGGRYHVEEFGTMGAGSTLNGAHVYAPPSGFGTTGIASNVASSGITVTGTTGPSDPTYVNRASRNYALQAGSPAAGKGARR